MFFCFFEFFFDFLLTLGKNNRKWNNNKKAFLVIFRVKNELLKEIWIGPKISTELSKWHKGLFLFCPQTNLFYINGFFYKIEMWIYFLFFPVDTQYTIFWQYYESILCPILCWSNNIKWNTTRFWIVFVDSNKLHWKNLSIKQSIKSLSTATKSIIL